MSSAVILSCGVWLASFASTYKGAVTGGVLEMGSGFYLTSDVSNFTRFFVREDIYSEVENLDESLAKHGGQLKPKATCHDKNNQNYWVLDFEYKGLKT